MDEIVFESPADQAGFVMLPNVVLLDSSLSVPSRLLYGMLIHFARKHGSCFPGQTKLASLLSVGERAVRNYLRELEDAMLVRTERRGSTSNRYVLLALGLRAKRMADRNVVSGRDDRNVVSGLTGNDVPPKKKQSKKTQSGVGTRGRARLKISGKPVKDGAWALTQQILAEFNRQTEKSLGAVNGTGQPSESAKRIYLRVVEWPELGFEQHADIIARTLASRWWGDDAPSVGVVYGPKVFEENVTRQPPRRSARDDSIRRGLEAIARLKGAS